MQYSSNVLRAYPFGCQILKDLNCLFLIMACSFFSVAVSLLIVFYMKMFHKRNIDSNWQQWWNQLEESVEYVCDTICDFRDSKTIADGMLSRYLFTFTAETVPFRLDYRLLWDSILVLAVEKNQSRPSTFENKVWKHPPFYMEKLTSCRFCAIYSIANCYPSPGGRTWGTAAINQEKSETE